jgi:hypothetical protein
LHTALSADVKDWKCRTCGFANEESDVVCETCKTRKPMRPRLENRLSYTDRHSPSPSSDRRSPSSEEEILFNRPVSPSPPSVRRRNSSRERSPSKTHTSDNDKSSHHSSTRSRGRRKSSHSYSSDDNQYQTSRNTTKQRRSSKGKYYIDIRSKLLTVLVFLSLIS